MGLHGEALLGAASNAGGVEHRVLAYQLLQVDEGRVGRSTRDVGQRSFVYVRPAQCHLRGKMRVCMYNVQCDDLSARPIAKLKSIIQFIFLEL